MHLDRDYSQVLFTRNECMAEVHRHWLAPARIAGITPETLSEWV